MTVSIESCCKGDQYANGLRSGWDGKFNKAGRGFPDVAAQAYNFHVFDKGYDSLIAGTSASAPTFAGVVGLLNSARIHAGQPPLGFLNPWIYSEGYRGLTDIVDGGSRGCTGIDSYSGLATVSFDAKQAASVVSLMSVSSHMCHMPVGTRPRDGTL